MNEWTSWCRLCGNLDASSDIDDEIRDATLTLFEVN